MIIEHDPARSVMLRATEALELLKFLQHDEALLQQIADEKRAATAD